MLIDHAWLRTLVTVSESETFGEAAKKQRVTTSAISQQMKALELALGAPIFERVGRMSRLTEAGAKLAKVARRGLEGLDDAVREFVVDEETIAGDVRIGAPRPFARVWLRPRLSKLIRAHDALRVTVDFGTPTDLGKRLEDGALDLAILVRAPDSPLVSSAPIFTERFHAYASPAYLAAHGAPKSAEDFASHKLIAFDRDLPMHHAWWRASFGSRAPLRGEIACYVASLDEMLALAEDGVGIVVLPDYFAENAAREKTLVQIRAHAKGRRGIEARNTIVLAWRKHALETARFIAARDALLT